MYALQSVFKKTVKRGFSSQVVLIHMYSFNNMENISMAVYKMWYFTNKWSMDEGLTVQDRHKR